MATHSSVLVWRIPGTGEPSGLPSVGSHRVGHNWSDLAVAAAAVSIYWLLPKTLNLDPVTLFPTICQLQSAFGHPPSISHSVISSSLWPHGLSMEFSRQEFWGGLPFRSPGDLPNPVTEPRSPALQADSLPSELPENPLLHPLKHASNSSISP